MSYQVIARKWRPQTFSEVVYQDHVSITIRNSIKNGRISHAYLFAGPRGVGKTTMARILAKSLNCAGGPTDTPCGTCRNCREIRDGHSFDVIEIDGASNRGIENIRELRESVAFAPVEGRYKIYIIDEVHMLTKEAFNALLKTLEEPPPHVVFIFATTEIHQVPETILSRCQKFYFKKMAVDAIAAHLAFIASKEGFNIDESAFYAIARASEGSMRDAQSLLDQVVSFSEGHINEESALAILGIVPMESHIVLLRHIADERAADAIMELDRVINLGADIPRYAAGFVDTLRAIRLMKNGIDLKTILGLSAQEAEMLTSATTLFNDEELSVFFRIITDLQRDLRFSSNERISIEMAVLDLIAAKARPSIAEIVQKLEDSARAEKSHSDAVDRVKKKTVEMTPIDSITHARKEETSVEQQSAPGAEKKSKSEPLTLERAWTRILTSIKEAKPYLFKQLQTMKPSFNNNAILLEPADTFNARMLDNKDIALIQEKASAVCGKEISVSQKGTHNQNLKGQAEEFFPGKTPDEIQHPSAAVSENETDPLTEKLIDLFHAQVINDKGEQ